jgi:hypothetical protein
MIREPTAPGDRELLCLDGITREPDRGVLWGGQDPPNPITFVSRSRLAELQW